MKKITSSNYRKDKLFPGVAAAVSEMMMRSGGVVSPVEVLLRMQRISKERYEDWRFGRIPYLERAFVGSLGKASRILRIVDLHAHSLGLQPSRSEYRQWGNKGRNRRIALRFSRSGEPRLEAAYSTHYLTKAQQQQEQDNDKRGEEPRSARLEHEDRREPIGPSPGAGD